jgi:adenosylhomocysteinase
LIFPGGKGPTSIVDDGGDMTIILIEGMKWEKIYAKSKELPDPSMVKSSDEKALYKLLKEMIPKNHNFFH